MRVARIITRLNRGGPARTILAIEPLLRDLGVETMLLTGAPGRYEDDLEPELRRTGIEVVRIESLSRSLRPWQDWSARRALRRELEGFGPEVVHTHTFKAGLLGRSLALPPGPRFVHTFHGHILRGYMPPPLARLMAILERRLARCCERLIAVSESVRRDLAQHFRVAPWNKFAIIPGIVPPEGESDDNSGDSGRPREELRAALGVPAQGPWIGTVARLARIKDPMGFLACAQRVLAVRPDVHFFWVGDGPLRERFQGRIRRFGLERSVHWFGWQQSTRPWHRRFDVEVLLSRNEGLPLSLLEARSLGIPVVATAVGGVADLIEHQKDGLLVAPGDPESAAEAILSCLAAPEAARRRADLALQRDQGRYTPEAHVEKLYRLYSELLGRTGPFPDERMRQD